MHASKFQIPGTTIYLAGDGSFSPRVEPGEQVVELTRDHSDMLEVVYHGRALRNIALSVASNSGSNPADAEGLPLADFNDYISLIPYGPQFLDFAKKLNDWITGAGGAEDPMLASLTRIHDALGLFSDFALAAWVTAREDNLAFLLAHSSTALRTTNTYLQANASRTDPVWAARIADAYTLSDLAVQTFGGNIERGYWLRPYSIAAMSADGNPTDYYHGWMPHMPDRAEVDEFKRVWDHRWALPALLYAVAVRVTVLRVFANSSAERQAACAEISQYTKILGRVFSKMWAGIRTLDHLSDLQVAWYKTTGRFPLAAADIHGGHYIGGAYVASSMRYSQWAPGLAPPTMISDPNDLDAVQTDVKRCAAHWWNLLYLRIGLDDLLLFISSLEAMCDAPWFATTFVNVHQDLRLAKTDGRVRDFALAATSLATLVRRDGDQPSATAARTHILYEALRSGGDRAQEIVANHVRELSPLAAKRATNTG